MPPPPRGGVAAPLPTGGMVPSAPGNGVPWLSRGGGSPPQIYGAISDHGTIVTEPAGVPGAAMGDGRFSSNS